MDAGEGTPGLDPNNYEGGKEMSGGVGRVMDTEGVGSVRAAFPSVKTPPPELRQKRVACRNLKKRYTRRCDAFACRQE